MNILGKLFQLKVSIIGVKKAGARTYGNPKATFKLVEISIAILSFGIRITIRI